MDYSQFRGLTDEELLLKLDELARVERENLPHFLACLAVVDERGAHRKPGYPSLFHYCTVKLRYSEDEAYRRIHAARAANRFNEIYSMLSDGSLSLTAVSKLAPHLTSSNALDLIFRAQGKTKRAVEEMLAAEFPAQDTADRIKALRMVTPAPLIPGPATSETREPNLEDLGKGPPKDPGPVQAPSPQPSNADGDRFEFSFTGSGTLRDTIERLKDLLWHKYPWGKLEDLLLEVCKDYLERHERQLNLVSTDPLPTKKDSSKRSVPTWVRRVVWARDRGRCAYVGPNGQRCETRRALEWDHIRPFSIGGRSDDPKNIRLLCRAHNDQERRRILGE